MIAAEEYRGAAAIKNPPASPAASREVEERLQVMTQRHAAQGRHHELVVVDGDIGLLEARGHLELARRDFVVTRDDRDAELVELVLHLGDAGLDPFRDTTEVVVLELLSA